MSEISLFGNYNEFFFLVFFYCFLIAPLYDPILLYWAAVTSTFLWRLKIIQIDFRYFLFEKQKIVFEFSFSSAPLVDYCFFIFVFN